MPNPVQPDEWDACAAAPEFHRILFENDSVRTLETIIRPGQIVPLHTHCWCGVSTVLSWSDMVRRDENGVVTFDSRASGVRREPGEAMWAEPFALHTLENVGDRAIHIVTVE
ncbi:MAG: hypothetical protein H7Y17_14990, partial [Chlorobia bacterium]|nr:hypothetical protein [Fimbriimonadaceae bacterium]